MRSVGVSGVSSRVPWARYREHAHSNISLRCRSHNQYEAELDFGTDHMAAYGKRAPARPDLDEADPGASSRSTPQVDSNPVGIGSRPVMS